EEPTTDAIICATDAAVGVLHAAERAGRRVPDDLLIASCTDESALRASTPSITSLDSQPRVLGQACAEVLVSIIEGNPSPGVQTVPTMIIERTSTRRDRSRATRISGAGHPGPRQ